MKKIMLYLLFLMVMSRPFAATVTGNNVNLRTDPSLKGEKLIVALSKGAEVQLVSIAPAEVIGDYGKNHWYEVSFNVRDKHYQAYVYGAFVEWKTNRECQLLREADNEASAFKTLPAGTSLKILELTEPIDDTGVPYWAKVKLQSGEEGWVYYDYVE